MKYTIRIDRKKWGRGQEGGGLLQSRDNYSVERCCLGFVALRCGYTQEDIRSMSDLTSLVESRGCARRGGKQPGLLALFTEKYREEGEWYSKGTQFEKRAISINDNRSISDSVRESRLTKLFAENGVRLVFFN